MANTDYVKKVHVIEFLERMKKQQPKDYDIVCEIEKRLENQRW